MATREESGARRQVADDVALARTELRQMISEEASALRHLIKSGPSGGGGGGGGGGLGGPPMPPNHLTLSVDSALPGGLMGSPRPGQGQWRAALADDQAESLVRMFSERVSEEWGRAGGGAM